MAKALEILVLDLVAELLAHAFVVLNSLQSAWAVAASPRQSLFDSFNYFLICVQRDFHNLRSLSRLS